MFELPTIAGLSPLYTGNGTPDVVIRYGPITHYEYQFPAHSKVLREHSQTFERQFASGEYGPGSTITILHRNRYAVDDMLSFFYHGSYEPLGPPEEGTTFIALFKLKADQHAAIYALAHRKNYGFIHLADYAFRAFERFMDEILGWLDDSRFDTARNAAASQNMDHEEQGDEEIDIDDGDTGEDVVKKELIKACWKNKRFAQDFAVYTRRKNHHLMAIPPSKQSRDFGRIPHPHGPAKAKLLTSLSQSNHGTITKPFPNPASFDKAAQNAHRDTTSTGNPAFLYITSILISPKMQDGSFLVRYLGKRTSAITWQPWRCPDAISNLRQPPRAFFLSTNGA
ncbi:hypothetical protein BKA58DRAFT_462939 [Alternaria rosae]|uniref:uncharacterized protein n=1 Tax=Alternaria rosae TaxID=1187941 RepID=UPI001E8E57EB|nr:uncharacterized protein BKA58DRAFT_462939 [Alternaria rosae]KAH6865245.1 hypothetical protein BKA58DRAFT_462939 [Alternaria rosae]